MQVEFIFNKIIKILLILLFASLTQTVIKFFIRNFRRRLKTASGETLSQKNQRLKTLTSLLNNATGLTITIIAIFLVLADLGINLTPFLTGAGILGIAIGLGMKDLAADMVAGFFLLLDNQINLGDQVEIGSARGKVQKVGLRTVVLKDKKGRYFYIPNSTIKVIIKEKR